MLHEIKPPLEQAVCVGDKSYLVENIGVMSQIPFPPAILVWLYTFQGPQSSLGSQGSFTIMRFHNFFLLCKNFTLFRHVKDETA